MEVKAIADTVVRNTDWSDVKEIWIAENRIDTQNNATTAIKTVYRGEIPRNILRELTDLLYKEMRMRVGYAVYVFGGSHRDDYKERIYHNFQNS